ncbi:MAG: methylated-DNA--[protein]-cysteine S-methyltransferase [Candidatus Methanoplasma sp.]|jgi:methylated-DNA-[protein]-cysteine S-methyltransferase|nr:methylated-DNA--[protein]-cysteine S-methyltransferase [Candidatus Methanoplasma sp.]
MSGRIHTFVTMIGKISISDDGMGNIDGLYLPNCNLPCKEDEETPIIAKAAQQVEEYISGKRKVFDLPLVFEGTEFQKSVWNAMRNIPYGKTESYKDLAERVGRPKAYRAVGTACSLNPIPLIVPCHRVVASDGIGGFSCGIVMKKKLMTIEGIEF